MHVKLRTPVSNILLMWLSEIVPGLGTPPVTHRASAPLPPRLFLCGSLGQPARPVPAAGQCSGGTAGPSQEASVHRMRPGRGGASRVTRVSVMTCSSESPQKVSTDGAARSSRPGVSRLTLGLTLVEGGESPVAGSLGLFHFYQVCVHISFMFQVSGI